MIRVIFIIIEDTSGVLEPDRDESQTDGAECLTGFFTDDKDRK